MGDRPTFVSLTLCGKRATEISIRLLSIGKQNSHLGDSYGVCVNRDTNFLEKRDSYGF